MKKRVNVYIDDFEQYAAGFINAAFDDFENVRGYRPSTNSSFFADILAKVCRFNVHVEIIGFWIYAFESYEYRQELAELGFWFSKKHKAWVFSGRKKANIRSKLTTDDVRNAHGYEVIRDRDEDSDAESEALTA